MTSTKRLFAFEVLSPSVGCISLISSIMTSQFCHHQLRLKSWRIYLYFFENPDCSLLIFAFLKPLLRPFRHSDHLITTLCPGFRRGAHGDAVIGFACWAHALAVACARLIELHGWTVLPGDKRAGTWETQVAHHLNTDIHISTLIRFINSWLKAF